MTPQEISEYKQNWMKCNPIAVPFCSDKKLEATQYCRQNFEQKDCWLRQWTDIYEHTMYFENQEFADKFKEYIKI